MASIWEDYRLDLDARSSGQHSHNRLRLQKSLLITEVPELSVNLRGRERVRDGKEDWMASHSLFLTYHVSLACRVSNTLYHNLKVFIILSLEQSNFYSGSEVKTFTHVMDFSL